MHNNITHIKHQQYQQHNVIFSHLPSALNTCRARWNLCQPLHFHNFRLQHCYHRNHRAQPLLPSDARRPTQNTHHAAQHTPRRRTHTTPPNTHHATGPNGYSGGKPWALVLICSLCLLEVTKQTPSGHWRAPTSWAKWNFHSAFHAMLGLTLDNQVFVTVARTLGEARKCSTLE